MSEAEEPKPFPRAKPIQRNQEERPKSKLPLILAGVAGGFLFLCLGCCGLSSFLGSQSTAERKAKEAAEKAEHVLLCYRISVAVADRRLGV